MTKTIVITGASDGIGKAAALRLHELGHQVVVVGRSPEKTKAVAEQIDTPFYTADFASLQAVRDLALRLKQDIPSIDVLVNNAGGLFAEREITIDGFEKTFQVNHLAPFLLTLLLKDTLISRHATVIATSSVAHRLLSRFDIDDLHLENHYTARRAYGNAKLANILFTKELQEKYGPAGINAISFHPGVVASNFASEAQGASRFLYHSPLRFLLRFISAEKGADTLVWLATTKPGTGEGWTPGDYYVKRKPASLSREALDRSLARSLWEKSEQMVAPFLNSLN